VEGAPVLERQHQRRCGGAAAAGEPAARAVTERKSAGVTFPGAGAGATCRCGRSYAACYSSCADASGAAPLAAVAIAGAGEAAVAADGVALLHSLLATAPAAAAITGNTALGTTIGVGTDPAFRNPVEVIFQTTFTYVASAATSVDVYYQTSLDGGLTWFDVANHQFLLATSKKLSALSSMIAPAAQAFVPVDGALAANTIIQGVLGQLWRPKITSVGTYGAGTQVTGWITVRGFE
jgi:hypothetical protein